MHIGFLCNEYPPGQHGGIGTFTQTLARALVAQGHQATVIGIYAEDSITDDMGVKVVRIAQSKVKKSGFLINGFRLRHALKRIHDTHPFDILEGPENSFAMVSARFPVAKIIRMNGGHHFFATTLGQALKPWRSFLERRSFQTANYYCAVSKFVGETTRTLLKMGDIPIPVLPNPVDTQRFAPMPDVSEEKGLIVFVGTLCEKKGIRQLVQAMPEIVAAIPQAHLLAIGRDWHDPKTGQSYQSQLKTVITPEMKPKVMFTGHIENTELPKMLARASVVVFPSHMEAQGIVVIEAMAMGKAIIFTKTGPGPELIIHGSSGLLCDPYQPASIAKQVIAVLENESLRQHLAIEARRRAIQEFSSEVIVAKNITFYHECLLS